jgi:medium-chain acyl-[acyl-carrier-protein] hydrolase
MMYDRFTGARMELLEKEELYRPESQDVDLEMRMRPNEIMNRLADLARRHAGETGFGYDDMLSRGLFWVVHEFIIAIDEMPMLDDDLILRTRPFFRKGLRADRQFEITRGGGRLVRAHTRWLLIDRESRRPQPLQRHFDAIGEPFFPPEELDGPKEMEPGDVRAVRRVGYSDVDMHRHTNNSGYVAWCLDLLPIDLWREFRVSRLHILFHKESFADQEISIHVSRSEDSNDYRFDGFRGEETIFTLSMQLESSR